MIKKKMSDEDLRLATINDTAKTLGISREAVKKLVAIGRLKSTMLAGRTRVTMKSIIALAEGKA